MKPFTLSLISCALFLGLSLAQTTDEVGSPQLPVGQTFKNFTFPSYKDGQLNYTFYAEQATGVTINRAVATNVKIELYENNVITTIITSPQADIYIGDKKLRTKNTIKIIRSDMEATAQIADFDLVTKKYLLRQNVKVILKNFNINAAVAAPGTSPNPAAQTPKPADTTSTNTPPVAAP